MEVLYRLSNTRIPENSYGLGLGNFDGIHLGHARIIDVLSEECGKLGIPSVIYTFRRHPENILKKDKNPIILSNEQKHPYWKNIILIFYISKSLLKNFPK